VPSPGLAKGGVRRSPEYRSRARRGDCHTQGPLPGPRSMDARWRRCSCPVLASCGLRATARRLGLCAASDAPPLPKPLRVKLPSGPGRRRASAAAGRRRRSRSPRRAGSAAGGKPRTHGHSHVAALGPPSPGSAGHAAARRRLPPSQDSAISGQDHCLGGARRAPSCRRDRPAGRTPVSSEPSTQPP